MTHSAHTLTFQRSVWLARCGDGESTAFTQCHHFNNARVPHRRLSVAITPQIVPWPRVKNSHQTKRSMPHRKENTPADRQRRLHRLQTHRKKKQFFANFVSWFRRNRDSGFRELAGANRPLFVRSGTACTAVCERQKSPLRSQANHAFRGLSFGLKPTRKNLTADQCPVVYRPRPVEIVSGLRFLFLNSGVKGK